MFCSEISTTPKATVTTVEAATVALVESAVAPVAVVIPVITEVSTSSPGAAFAGATVNIPKPREATATSAMRLKVVFVDICFLSLVDPKDFFRSAWRRRRHSSDMRGSFLSVGITFWICRWLE
jgi:hypothetical protein